MNTFSLFPITYSIIAVTVLISFLAFNNAEAKGKLLFYPYGMKSPQEYYRFISHGFIHADYIHLFFNMYTFYSFGRSYVLYYLPGEKSSKILYRKAG